MCFTVKHAFYFEANHTEAWQEKPEQGRFGKCLHRTMFSGWALKWLESSDLRNVTIIISSLVAYQQNMTHNYWNVPKCFFLFMHQLFLLWVTSESRPVCHHWSQRAISWISSLSLLTTSASYVSFQMWSVPWQSEKNRNTKQDKAVSRQWISGC